MSTWKVGRVKGRTGIGHFTTKQREGQLGEWTLVQLMSAGYGQQSQFLEALMLSRITVNGDGFICAYSLTTSLIFLSFFSLGNFLCTCTKSRLFSKAYKEWTQSFLGSLMLSCTTPRSVHPIRFAFPSPSLLYLVFLISSHLYLILFSAVTPS